MASLLEIAEIVWLQIGGGTDESSTELETVAASARLEYAWQMLQMAWRDKRENGEYIVPAYLSREKELKIVANEADISDLNILRAIPQEMWLQQISGLDGCIYTKTTINMAQLMDGDDALGADAKTYMIIGNKIKFPKGTHADKLNLIYANDGSDLDADDVNVDDAIGALVKERLLASYLGKIVPEDKTNNSNSST